MGISVDGLFYRIIKDVEAAKLAAVQGYDMQFDCTQSKLSDEVAYKSKADPNETFWGRPSFDSMKRLFELTPPEGEIWRFRAVWTGNIEDMP